MPHGDVPSGQTIVIVDRRELASEQLAQSFRELSFSPVVVPDLAQAAAVYPQEIAVWAIPVSGGDLAWLEMARRHAHSLRLLTLGRHLPVALQTELLLAGAAGYVEHSESPGKIVAAARIVLAGGRHFAPEVLFATIDALHRNPDRGRRRARDARDLTRRETEIAQRVAMGESNKEIAHKLHVNVSTVKTHLKNIFEKLAVGSRVALALKVAAHPSRFVWPAARTAAAAGGRKSRSHGD